MNLFLNKLLNKINNIYVARLGGLVRSIKSPSFPKNVDGKVLVHIGCGECNDQRYINIDARSMPHVHYISSSLELRQFLSGSIDLIYACHVLEHVSHRELMLILANWFSRLKKNGALRLSVPNFDTIVKIYQDQGENIDTIKLPLLGGQEYAFNFHHSVFNRSYLNELLKSCGFTVIKEWDPQSALYYNFDDWASRPFVVKGKEYPLSLKLEAVK